jgi:hypothetical protein
MVKMKVLLTLPSLSCITTSTKTADDIFLQCSDQMDPLTAEEQEEKEQLLEEVG